MKRLIIVFLLFILSQPSFAEGLLSKQATAFYSDNNRQKTMDLILQINEKDRTAQDWLLLGNVIEDNGEPDNAVFMYNKAIEKDKKFYKAYYNLGNYYTTKGQFDLAIKNYKKAAKIKYDNPYIYYNLGCTYIKMGDYKKARSSFNKALMYKKDLPEIHYNLAYTYQQMGNKKMFYRYMYNYNEMTKQE
ncbi:tetratricopeptide repeat protein [bacterium]|nr:tetratricopeptide repeat protein [bacterium]